ILVLLVAGVVGLFFGSLFFGGCGGSARIRRFLCDLGVVVVGFDGVVVVAGGLGVVVVALEVFFGVVVLFFPHGLSLRAGGDADFGTCWMGSCLVVLIVVALVGLACTVVMGGVWILFESLLVSKSVEICRFLVFLVDLFCVGVHCFEVVC
ncbi:hypothetical protein L195_g047431, partial [Trifolium pratense]